MAQQGPYSGNCSLIFPVCEHLYIYTNTNTNTDALLNCFSNSMEQCLLSTRPSLEYEPGYPEILLS